MGNSIFRVAIVGLGYVGLPLAVHIANKGIQVNGYDSNNMKIKVLNSGNSYIPDVPSEVIHRLINSHSVRVCKPSGEISRATHVIVTVPTPLSRQREPQLNALKRATEHIAQHLSRGQTVIYESSTYPGTLEEVVLPILSRSGMVVGKDYFLGYSPERIDPGNTEYSIERIPKVISGQTKACLQQVKRLYERLFLTVVPVQSPKVAELCKLFENIQRLVNISLVNEMEVLCEEIKIDFREVLEAAATKPFGFTPYWPGPGIGGHCIPVDPLYFQWKAKQYGLQSKLIQAADAINRTMPQHIVNRIHKALNSANHQGHENDKKSVFVIGMAYKKDVNDIRESTALTIFQMLLEQGYKVEYYDPYVPNVKIKDTNYVSKALTASILKQNDAVVILTDHSNIEWSLVAKHARTIVDMRGVIPKQRGQVMSS